MLKYDIVLGCLICTVLCLALVGSFEVDQEANQTLVIYHHIYTALYYVVVVVVGGPYNFRFRVKLYPIQPTYLFEESTR